MAASIKLLTTLVLTAAAITDAVNAVKADKAKDEDLAILQNLSILYSVILASISDTPEGVVLKEWLSAKCEHVAQGYNDGLEAYKLLTTKFGDVTTAGQNAVDANNIIDSLDHIKLESGGNSDAFINKLNAAFLKLDELGETVSDRAQARRLLKGTFTSQWWEMAKVEARH